MSIKQLSIVKLILIVVAVLDGVQLIADIAIQVPQDSKLIRSSFSKLAKEVESRTSLSLSDKVQTSDLKNLSQGWLWISPSDVQGARANEIFEAVRRGILLVIEGRLTTKEETRILDFFPKGLRSGLIRTIALDHTLTRSFHLLKRLPTCLESTWNEVMYDQRAAVIMVPYQFSASLADAAVSESCIAEVSLEERTRIFINLLMYALTMDYKNDQIHLPEILKRIR